MSAACCVCAREGADLRKCFQPRCRNFVCPRHALTFELNDEIEPRLEYFCSRRCWVEMQHRAVPPLQQLAIALLVVGVTMVLYLYVVSLFI